MKIEKNIQNTLILTFAIFFLMSIIGISFYSYNQFESNLRENYKEKNYSQLNGIASNLNIYFDEINTLSTIFLLSDTVDPLLKKSEMSKREMLESSWYIDNFFGKIINQRKDLLRLAIYDSDYELQYRRGLQNLISPLTLDKVLLGKMKYSNGKFMIFGVRDTGEKSYKKNVFTIGREIIDLNNNETLGYVLFDLSLDIFDSINKTSGWKFSLASKDDIILYDSDRQNIGMTVEKLKGILNQTDMIEFDEDSFKLKYVLFSNDKELLNVIYDAQIKYILISLITYLLVMGTTVFVARSISKSLKNLENCMKNISDTGFEDYLQDTNSLAEIKALTTQYNTMLDEIQRLIRKEKINENKKMQAEFQALQFQIRPHFVYNALETINSMALINKDIEVSNMIRSLSRIMKYNVNFKKKFVTFQEELNHVKDYCLLEATVFQTKYKIIYHVDDKYLNNSVIKFMLQPLVENAISHGMSDIDCGGIIELFVDEDEKYFYYCVRDNGNGINKEELERIKFILSNDINELYEYNSKNPSIGLSNVQLRLKFAMGESSKILIDSSLSGTIVKIRLPKNIGMK